MNDPFFFLSGFLMAPWDESQSTLLTSLDISKRVFKNIESYVNKFLQKNIFYYNELWIADKTVKKNTFFNFLWQYEINVLKTK